MMTLTQSSSELEAELNNLFTLVPSDERVVVEKTGARNTQEIVSTKQNDTLDYLNQALSKLRDWKSDYVLAGRL
jgi:hypothetical protein